MPIVDAGCGIEMGLIFVGGPLLKLQCTEWWLGGRSFAYRNPFLVPMAPTNFFFVEG